MNEMLKLWLVGIVSGVVSAVTVVMLIVYL